MTIPGTIDAGDTAIIDTDPVAVCACCPACCQDGRLRDPIIRELVDLPVVGFPTGLHVRVPRLICTNDACPSRIR